jgi:NAD(P)-dependent dehydrogenase (short-subunit alcohol dehydrogenase family)
VVTGAGSGIGLAITESFIAAGIKVLMTDINRSAVEEAARVLRQGGAQVEWVSLDVSDQTAVDRVAELAVSRFGGLHIAVNNAGIVNGGRVWELSLEEWHRVLDVNLWGVIHGVRSFVPAILGTGDEGHVVNVASMAAVNPMANIGPYVVAKHGILGLSDVLRADLAAIGASVGVSVVLPGRIKTGMNPIGTVEASVVAKNVVDAMIRERPYVFTDDHAAGAVEERLQAILSARHQVIGE